MRGGRKGESTVRGDGSTLTFQKTYTGKGVKMTVRLGRGVLTKGHDYSDGGLSEGTRLEKLTERIGGWVGEVVVTRE